MTDVEKLMTLFDILGVDYTYTGKWLVAAGRNFRIAEATGNVIEVLDLVHPKRSH